MTQLRLARIAFVAMALAFTFPSAVALAQEGGGDGPQVSWIEGPKKVDLGSEAEIDVAEGYIFADAADTKKLMAAMGNAVDGTEVGMVAPAAEDKDWLMVFEYRPVGFVKDDDKDEIDKDALFASIRDGTEQANEQRKKQGIPGLHVVRWFEEPNYDEATHNLQWALLAKTDDGHEVVNYNVRLLGRRGYMSVTLVDEPGKLAVSKPEMVALLKGFGYKSGSRYAEFVKGDRVAEYGLAALVAGGAGVAAAKLGLFAALGKLIAKGGKAIIIFVLAVGVVLKNTIARLFGRGRTEVEAGEQSS